MAKSLFLVDGSTKLIFHEDDGYEQIADGYLALLRDVLDALDDILLFFDASRLDRRKVHKALQRCRDNLYRNL